MMRILIPFNSNETRKLMEQYLAKLKEFESAAQNLSEEDFRRKFRISNSNMPFAVQPPINESLNVYRARSVKNFKGDITDPAAFSYYPLELADKTHPSLQRCNFSGQPVFYGSFSLITNFREICDIEEGTEVYVSKWRINENSNMNLYRIYPPDGVVLNNDYHGILKLENLSVLNSPCQKYLQYFGEIMMREGGDKYKKNYLPTALVSSSIFNFKYTCPNGSEIEYHGIAYPSTKVKSGAEVNVAFKPSFVDEHMTLEYVIKVRLSRNLSCVLQEIGDNSNGKIKWFRPVLNSCNIHPRFISFEDSNGNLIELSDGKIFDDSHNTIEVNDIFYDNLDAIKSNIQATSPDIIVSTDFILKMICEKKVKCCKIPVDGWTFERPNQIIYIKYLLIEFEFHADLAPIE